VGLGSDVIVDLQFYISSHRPLACIPNGHSQIPKRLRWNRRLWPDAFITGLNLRMRFYMDELVLVSYLIIGCKALDLTSFI
jgi:hypothetical protein